MQVNHTTQARRQRTANFIMGALAFVGGALAIWSATKGPVNSDSAFDEPEVPAEHKSPPSA